MPFLPRHLSSFPLLFICQRYKTEFYKQSVRNRLYQNHQVTNLSKEQAYTRVSLTKPVHGKGKVIHITGLCGPGGG